MADERIIVAARFGKSDRTYDYFADFPVAVGQRAWVETSRGEAKVEIMAIKTESDQAKSPLLRLVEETPEESE